MAVDFGIEPRPVDGGMGEAFHRHLFHRERLAENVLGELFQFDFLVAGHEVAVMDVEPGASLDEMDAFG